MNVVYENIKQKLNLFDKNQSDNLGYTRVTMSPYFNRLDLQNRYTKLNNPPATFSILGESLHTQNNVEYQNQFFDYNIYSSPKQFKGKYIIPVGVNRDPGFWGGMSKYRSRLTSTLPNTGWGHLFSSINIEYLSDLRSKRAFLAIDTSLEGYHEQWLWSYFREGCNLFNIPIEQIIYITINNGKD